MRYFPPWPECHPRLSLLFFNWTEENSHSFNSALHLRCQGYLGTPRPTASAGSHSGKDSLVSFAAVMHREMTLQGRAFMFEGRRHRAKRKPFKGKDFSYLSVLTSIKNPWHWEPCACMLSCVRLFATPWIVVSPAPLSTELSRQEYWNGLQCPPSGCLPNPGIEPVSLASPELTGRFFTAGPPGKPYIYLALAYYKTEGSPRFSLSPPTAAVTWGCARNFSHLLARLSSMCIPNPGFPKVNAKVWRPRGRGGKRMPSLEW